MTIAGRISVGHPVDAASGVLWNDCDDFTLHGRMPLSLHRRYSTSLTARPGMFGPGWFSPFEMRIRRDVDGFVLLAEDGETEVYFDCFQEDLESGVAVRNLALFYEARQSHDSIVVTRWHPEDLEAEDTDEDQTSVFEHTDVRTEEGESVVQFVFPLPRADEWSCLASRQYPDGRGIDLERDSDNRLLEVRQRRERRGFRFFRNSQGLVSHVEIFTPRKHDPAREREYRRVASYEYDRTGRLIRSSNLSGVTIAYNYDDTGRLVEETSNGVTYRFRFDKQDRCVEAAGPDSFDSHTLEYHENPKLTRITNSRGDQRILTFNAAGQVESETSALGHAGTHSYDELGRTVEQMDPGGGVTKYQYDSNGDLILVATPAGAVTAFEYNASHQVTTVTDPAGHRWLKAYDGSGRLISILNPHGAAWSYRYDERGDLRELLNPSGARRTFEWDELGDPVSASDSSGNLTRYEYDSFGYPASRTDALGNRTDFSNELDGKLSRVRFPDGASRDYQWNAFGQISKYVDELGAATSFRYSGCGLLTEELRPDGTGFQLAWSAIPGQLLTVTNEKGETLSFEYDSDERMVRQTDFAGKVTSFEYTPDGEVSAITHADGRRLAFERDTDGFLTAATDDLGSLQSFEYDPRGYLVKAANADCVIEHHYDEAGQLVWERQGPCELTHRYDVDGNRIQRESSLGDRTKFSWTPDGLIDSVAATAAEPITFQYDEVRNEISRGFGRVRVQNTFDSRNRNRAQWLAYEELSKRERLLSRFTYDAVGNPIDKASAGSRAVYRFDSLDRLVTAGKANTEAEQVKYDSTDNVIAVERLGGPSYSCVYAPGSRIVSANNATYTFDEVGRLILKSAADGTTQFTWDGFGQLVNVTLPNGAEWEYAYDALGRRVRKAGPTGVTEYCWDGDVILHEITRRNGDLRVAQWEFEPFSYAPVSKIEGRNQYLFVSNTAGTPEELIAADGSVVWKADPNVFGGIETAIDQVQCPIRLQGQWYDAETGLHYNRFRYYDPELNRFISPDPGGLSGGLNPYAFAQNTLAWVDPLGLKRCPPKGRKRGPKPWPKGPHNRTIQRRIRALKKQHPTWRHVGGGTKKERVIRTPGGTKDPRRPDITFVRPDGSEYHENVGRSRVNAQGRVEPVPREVSALDDLERVTGTRPRFTPYDR